mgnify:CR=1 FL=1
MTTMNENQLDRIEAKLDKLLEIWGEDSTKNFQPKKHQHKTTMLMETLKIQDMNVGDTVCHICSDEKDLTSIRNAVCNWSKTRSKKFITRSSGLYLYISRVEAPNDAN